MVSADPASRTQSRAYSWYFFVCNGVINYLNNSAPGPRLSKSFTNAHTQAPDQSLLFLCRSGGRSLSAARGAMAAGFSRTYSIRGARHAHSYRLPLRCAGDFERAVFAVGACSDRFRCCGRGGGVWSGIRRRRRCPSGYSVQSDGF
jgi:hypothetical protein